MATATTQIIVKAIDQFSGKMKAMGKSLDDFGDKLDRQAEGSRKFGLALGAVGIAAGALGFKMLKAAGDTESTMVAFETMLGTAEKAKSFYQDLVNFAARTPFELKGLENASKQLLAYGFQQEDVIPNLKALGDIASGVGMDKLPNLILAFGQVKAATKLTGMELRQFTEAGVPLLDELSKQMGTSAAEIQKMVSAGEIGFPQVQQALVALTEDGGRFNNLMDKQANSLNGMISNLADAWDIFLRGEGQKLLEWAKNFVAFAIDIVQNHLPKWINAISRLTDFLSRHTIALYAVAGALVGALIPSIYAAAVAFAALAIPLLPFIIGGAIVGGIIAGAIAIVKNFGKIIGIVKKVGAVFVALKNYFKGVLTDGDYLNDFLTHLPKPLQDLAKKIGIFIAITKALWEDFVTVVQKVGEIVAKTLYTIFVDIPNRMREATTAIFQSIWGAIIATVQTFAEMIKTAVGAIFEAIKFVVALGIGLVIGYFEKMGVDIVAVFAQMKSDIVDAFNAIVGFAVAFFDNMKSNFLTFTTIVSEAWSQLWEGVSLFFTTIWTTITEYFRAKLDEILVFFQEKISLVKNVWTLTWDTMGQFFTLWWEGIKTRLSNYLGFVVQIINAVAGPIKEGWSALWSAVSDITSSAWSGIKEVVKESINWIIDKINWFIRKANEIARKGGGALGIEIPILGEIPKLATGGIVKQPTIAQIGEAGPEAVVPLKNGGLGLGTTINIILKDNMLLDRDAGRMIGNQIVQELKLSNQISTSI